MTMPSRRIGSHPVSAVGLGCMNLSHAYGSPPPADQAARLLNRALDLGCTHLDTAPLYGIGENEKLIASAVMHRKSEFMLASKCVLFGEGKQRHLDGRPEAIKRTVEASLMRLGIETLDLCYLHRLDRNVPIEESMGALADLHAQGKIGAAGVSEMSAATISRAHAVFPVTAVQSEYSPWTRNPEVAVLDLCRRLGIAFVAFSPTGRGFLAGSVQGDQLEEGDIRKVMPRFVEPNFSANLHLLEAFRAVAQNVGCTPAQLSIAWTLARGDFIVPIPGTRSIEHLEQNCAAAGLVLDPSTIAKIDAIFAPGSVQGARYTASVQTQMDTELLPEEMQPA